MRHVIYFIRARNNNYYQPSFSAPPPSTAVDRVGDNNYHNSCRSIICRRRSGVYKTSHVGTAVHCAPHAPAYSPIYFCVCVHLLIFYNFIFQNYNADVDGFVCVCVYTYLAILRYRIGLNRTISSVHFLYVPI